MKVPVEESPLFVLVPLKGIVEIVIRDGEIEGAAPYRDVAPKEVAKVDQADARCKRSLVCGYRFTSPEVPTGFIQVELVKEKLATPSVMMTCGLVPQSSNVQWSNARVLCPVASALILSAKIPSSDASPSPEKSR